MSDEFVNASETGEIPSFNGDKKAKATDFANYFCAYAQLYHQKQMLTDHNRMAAYHSAILGNSDIFKDKVVMDVGTGSGILAVWAALAGARKVYASTLYQMLSCSVMKSDYRLELFGRQKHAKSANIIHLSHPFLHNTHTFQSNIQTWPSMQKVS